MRYAVRGAGDEESRYKVQGPGYSIFDLRFSLFVLHITAPGEVNASRFVFTNSVKMPGRIPSLRPLDKNCHHERSRVTPITLAVGLLRPPVSYLH